MEEDVIFRYGEDANVKFTYYCTGIFFICVYVIQTFLYRDFFICVYV
jgi:hypothetical protein